MDRTFSKTDAKNIKNNFEVFFIICKKKCISLFNSKCIYDFFTWMIPYLAGYAIMLKMRAHKLLRYKYKAIYNVLNLKKKC